MNRQLQEDDCAAGCCVHVLCHAGRAGSDWSIPKLAALRCFRCRGKPGPAYLMQGSIARMRAALAQTGRWNWYQRPGIAPALGEATFIGARVKANCS